MRFLAAALIVLRFGGVEGAAEDEPRDFLAAQRAFIAKEMRFLAAALSTPRFLGADAPLDVLPGPRRPPSRAAMAALSLSRSDFSSVRILSRVKLNSSQGWSARGGESAMSRSEYIT